MTRRDHLAEQATDYVLEMGLIGLSLRPLAFALGTSDRMLNYHFGNKDQLIVDVLGVACRRSSEKVRALPPATSVNQAVLDLWVAVNGAELQRCQRMYVEAAALGLLGSEPYASAVRESNDVWFDAVRDFLVASGAPPRRVKRMATLLDSAFMGFQLDLPLDENSADIGRAVKDLAAAVDALSG